MLSDVAHAGRLWDDQAGLYYNRARWYDADTGRFLSEDPIEDGSNWYAYAGNNPVTFVDPSGLSIQNPLSSIGNFLGQASNAFADGINSTVSTFTPTAPSFAETPGAFIEAIRQSNTTARRQERQLFESIGGAPFTFDELQDSSNVRLVQNPNTNTAFNVIPFGITKGRDRFATDIEFEGNNFKVILGQAARPTGEGPPIATVQGVRRAPIGPRSDSIIAQEFFDREQNAFTRASVTATVNSGLLALDAVMLGRTGTLRPSVGTPLESAPRTGGRLGNAATRRHVSQVADELESRGFEITGGGGRFPEQYIPGPNGARKGSAFPDITATKKGRSIHVNTVDTLVNGVTPTAREARNATKIRQLVPNEHLIIVPKPN